MRTNVTPSSLYKLTPAAVATYAGHEHEIASCASNVLIRQQALLVPDCDGTIHTVGAEGSEMQLTSYVDSLLGYKRGTGIWTVVNLRPSPEIDAAFLVNSVRINGSKEKSSTVSRIKPPKGLKMPIVVKGAEIRDAASNLANGSFTYMGS